VIKLEMFFEKFNIQGLLGDITKDKMIISIPEEFKEFETMLSR